MRILVRLGFGVAEPQQAAAISTRDQPRARLDVSQQRYLCRRRLLLFLLAGLLLCCLLRFLSHLTLHYPKVGKMQVDLDLHNDRVHHNRKIDTPRFEQGKRRARRIGLWPREVLSTCVDAYVLRSAEMPRIGSSSVDRRPSKSGQASGVCATAVSTPTVMDERKQRGRPEKSRTPRDRRSVPLPGPT